MCESRFFEAGACWHICTPGENSFVFFTCDHDYVQGMNLMGLCADRFYGKVKIYTFELMSNHIHIVLSGSIKDCRAFYNLFKKKLRTYFSRLKRPVPDQMLEPQYISVQDLSNLRYAILYVNRNGYVNTFHYSPYCYPWGANLYFHAPFLSRMSAGRFSEISGRKRKEVLRSEDVEVSDRLLYMNLRFFNGKCAEFAQRNLPMECAQASDAGWKSGMMILPYSYCYIKEAEGFFRGVQHYVIDLFKNREVFGPIAEMVGEDMHMTDDEVMEILFPIMKERFDTFRVASLSLDQKRQLAVTLHFKYRCRVLQMGRILALRKEVLKEWFPQATE